MIAIFSIMIKAMFHFWTLAIRSFECSCLYSFTHPLYDCDKAMAARFMRIIKPKSPPGNVDQDILIDTNSIVMLRRDGTVIKIIQTPHFEWQWDLGTIVSAKQVYEAMMKLIVDKSVTDDATIKGTITITMNVDVGQSPKASFSWRLPRHRHFCLPRRFRHARLLLPRRRHANHGSCQGQHSFLRKKSSGSDSPQCALRAARLLGRSRRPGAQGASDFLGGRFARRPGRDCDSPGALRRKVSGFVGRHAGARRLDHPA